MDEQCRQHSSSLERVGKRPSEVEQVKKRRRDSRNKCNAVCWKQREWTTDSHRCTSLKQTHLEDNRARPHNFRVPSTLGQGTVALESPPMKPTSLFTDGGSGSEASCIWGDAVD